MNSSTFLGRLTPSWSLLALLLIAAVQLYRSPYSASALEIPPDTVEFALAPLQLVETGRYEIIVEGRGLPPRYPPWFPALVILPAYVLFGHDPGNAILPISLLAVAGVGFAYAIGKRIGSSIGGVFAALALLFLPSYSHWAIEVMTDVPCTTLMLATCLVYLRLRAKPESALTYLGAGTLVAITTLFRPVYAAMLLPFLLAVVRPRRGALLRAILLIAPMAAAAAATLAYNAATFGSPFRDGYKFWVPAPMDYPTMIFALSHVPQNLEVLGLIGFPILILVCVAAVRLARTFRASAFAASRESFRDVLLFFVLTTGPILLFHLFYFFADDRFYLPALAGTAVLAGSILGLLVGPGRETILKVLLPALFVIALGARLATPALVPGRRQAAEQVRQHTPDNAVIISGIDPVYLARLAGRGSARRIVPISRNVEFAWALLVRKRVDDPRVALSKWPDLQPALELLRPHAEEAVHFVASEHLDELATDVAQGTPVFLESSFISSRDAKVVEGLYARFKLIERAPNLYQLQLH
jgi:4-amino-4-deoxy-L-arabinose transferase-like glycosyltransferase